MRGCIFCAHIHNSYDSGRIHDSAALTSTKFGRSGCPCPVKNGHPAGPYLPTPQVPGRSDAGWLF